MARLLDALRAVQARREQRRGSWTAVHDRDEFVIAYPPGVPIHVPGEEWDEAQVASVRELSRSGADIFCVAPPPGAARTVRRDEGAPALVGVASVPPPASKEKTS